jgi:hypothetical protein
MISVARHRSDFGASAVRLRVGRGRRERMGVARWFRILLVSAFVGRDISLSTEAVKALVEVIIGH